MATAAAATFIHCLFQKEQFYRSQPLPSQCPGMQHPKFQDCGSSTALAPGEAGWLLCISVDASSLLLNTLNKGTSATSAR